MKLTDLAILDWVLINNTPHRIQAIDSIDAKILADDDLYYVGEDRCHSEDKIEGIPITPEILKKNGFKYKTTDWEAVYAGPHYGKYGLKKFHVLIGKENIILASYYGYMGRGDVDAHEFAYINYVHELQHALRLCGLNELTDNFKV